METVSAKDAVLMLSIDMLFTVFCVVKPENVEEKSFHKVFPKRKLCRVHYGEMHLT